MRVLTEPITQELVLIGGGHTHAIALRMMGMKALPGVRVTLISEASESAYSGMLPGRVAGIYRDPECFVNLATLADFAEAQFYVDRVTGLDLTNRKILCDRHPPVAFDVLSIDIGSTPTLLPEIKPNAPILPAKPVRPFLDRWDALLHCISRQPELPIRLAIVGGGAGGVELAFTMQHQIHTILQTAGQPLTNLQLHIIHRGGQLVPQFNSWAQHHIQALLHQRQVQVHLHETVNSVQGTLLTCASGLTLNCDAIVWVTQAAAPDWLAKAGLAVDDRGFVQVNDGLQSISHPFVFAVGDVATMVNHPRPKAGVFAVRQGPPLVQNLRRFLQNRPLKPFHPQKHYLSLLNTADGQAIGIRGRFGWRSALLWHWKDHIDRSFMRRLNDLPKMDQGMGLQIRKTVQPHQTKADATNDHGPAMYCAGCGSKVGSTILKRVLQRLQPHALPLVDFAQTTSEFATGQTAIKPKILVDLSFPDDAAVIQVANDQIMVQSVDFFPALVSDPFVFGQISANHALSDVYAMGAQPHSALAIATIPHASEALVEESLYQLLAGALQVLQQAGATLIGGHTTEATELAFGLTCNGFTSADRLMRKGGLQLGQALILTKPLGTGTLFAAKMQRKALGRWLDQAVASMLRSNQQAAQCFLRYGVTTCTDITGFGLIGHLLEMVQASTVGALVNLDAIPVLAGALATIEQGILSSLQSQNRHASHAIANASTLPDHPKFQLLFDPQTSGGLLAAVPLEFETSCVAALRHLGYTHSCTIGYTQPRLPEQAPITIA